VIGRLCCRVTRFTCLGCNCHDKYDQKPIMVRVIGVERALPGPMRWDLKRAVRTRVRLSHRKELRHCLHIRAAGLTYHYKTCILRFKCCHNSLQTIQTFLKTRYCYSKRLSNTFLERCSMTTNSCLPSDATDHICTATQRKMTAIGEWVIILYYSTTRRRVRNVYEVDRSGKHHHVRGPSPIPKKATLRSLLPLPSPYSRPVPSSTSGPAIFGVTRAGCVPVHTRHRPESRTRGNPSS
jgi:hypothetical protein